MLAATVRVEAIDSSDERMWRALNLRSADQGIGEVAELTPTQTMFAVMATKGMLETLELLLALRPPVSLGRKTLSKPRVQKR